MSNIFLFNRLEDRDEYAYITFSLFPFKLVNHF